MSFIGKKPADVIVPGQIFTPGSVSGQTIQDGAISTPKVADAAVTTAKVADNAVTTAKINNGAVTTDKVADNAVTTNKINNGAVTMAKLAASGTPSAGNFLRGDGVWQEISVSPTTAQVLAATAGASAGAVGTYALLGKTSGGTLGVGATVAGSSLRYISIRLSTDNGGAPSGTWRSMGLDVGTDGDGWYRGTVYLRIA